MLHPENRHVLAFLRSLDDETILVVANLSRFPQPVELDLSDYEGRRPVEMFGRIEFPVVARAPYALSLGPHDFLWFTLDHVPGRLDAGGHEAPLATLAAAGIGDLIDGRLDVALDAALRPWFATQSWYRGHARRVSHGEIIDRFDLPVGGGSALILIVLVAYSEGEPDTYLVPLTTGHLVDGSFVFAGCGNGAGRVPGGRRPRSEIRERSHRRDRPSPASAGRRGPTGRPAGAESARIDRARTGCFAG
jgi:maltose alpha-D-glucosyltransferase/alpha-amylase